MMVIKDMRQAARIADENNDLELWTCCQNGPYHREARVVPAPVLKKKMDWSDKVMRFGIR